jgi:hypothetical protein
MDSKEKWFKEEPSQSGAQSWAFSAGVLDEKLRSGKSWPYEINNKDIWGA